MRDNILNEYVARADLYEALIELDRVLAEADAPHDSRVQTRVDFLFQWDLLDQLFNRLTPEEVTEMHARRKTSRSAIAGTASHR